MAWAAGCCSCAVLLLTVSLSPAFGSSLLGLYSFENDRFEPNATVTGVYVSPMELSNLNGTQPSFVDGLDASQGFAGPLWSTVSFAGTGSFENFQAFEFSVAPLEYRTLNLVSIRFNERRSFTGPRRWQLRSSVDGYASVLAEKSLPDTSDWREHSIALPDASFGSLSGLATFRLMADGAERDTGVWRVDDVQVMGNASNASAADVLALYGFENDVLSASAVPGIETFPLSFQGTVDPSFLDGYPAGQSLGAPDWPLANETVDNGVFVPGFVFTVQPQALYNTQLTAIRFQERRSLTGPRRWEMRANIDGFLTPLAAVDIPDNDEWRTHTVDLSSVLPNNARLTSPITFALRATNAERSTGTWRIDNLAVTGITVFGTTTTTTSQTTSTTSTTTTSETTTSTTTPTTTSATTSTTSSTTTSFASTTTFTTSTTTTPSIRDISGTSNTAMIALIACLAACCVASCLALCFTMCNDYFFGSQDEKTLANVAPGGGGALPWEPNEFVFDDVPEGDGVSQSGAMVQHDNDNYSVAAASVGAASVAYYGSYDSVSVEDWSMGRGGDWGQDADFWNMQPTESAVVPYSGQTHTHRQRYKYRVPTVSPTNQNVAAQYQPQRTYYYNQQAQPQPQQPVYYGAPPVNVPKVPYALPQQQFLQVAPDGFLEWDFEF